MRSTGMSEIDRSVHHAPQRGGRHAGSGGTSSYLDSDDAVQEIGFADALNWLSRHRVSVTAAAMIVVSLIWKAGFLGQFYFRQDDIHFTEIALRSPLDWRYLSYVGAGHLHPGVLLIVWIMARVALYNWGAASAVLLAMLAVASVAAWWLLRTLIGNRPAILIPLALYLVTPLTFANDSWWQSGIESAPLQAVIFLSLIAHIRYVRSGRARHLVAAAAALAAGLFFFEKAAVVPVVLFAVTGGFLLDGKLAVTARQALVRYWRAWLVYGAMVVVYVAVLVTALHSSTVKPAPSSLGNAVSFALNLIRDTLAPGLVGGPWRWFFTPADAIAYSAAPSQLAWLSLLVVGAIVVASVMTRALAWRAWAILAVWVLLADVAPVFLGRLSSLGRFAWVFELDTRYVADSAAVAAICVALAFWPVVRPQEKGEPNRDRRRQQEYFTGQTWRVVGLCLTGVLVIGSIVSVHEYEQVTALTNFAGQTFLDNAKNALTVALPPGSVIRDDVMPPYLMTHAFYDNDALESAVLGPMASRATARNVRWVQHPSGTVDNLLIFNSAGVLTRAVIGHGVRSLAGQACWPFRKDRAVISFAAPAPATVGTLRVGYYGGAAAIGETVAVAYGGEIRHFVVKAGPVHAVYLPITGSATGVTITVPSAAGLCIGDVEAGNLDAGFPLVLK
jgi:hypothetical protein